MKQRREAVLDQILTGLDTLVNAKTEEAVHCLQESIVEAIEQVGNELMCRIGEETLGSGIRDLNEGTRPRAPR